MCNKRWSPGRGSQARSGGQGVPRAAGGGQRRPHRGMRRLAAPAVRKARLLQPHHQASDGGQLLHAEAVPHLQALQLAASRWDVADDHAPARQQEGQSVLLSNRAQRRCLRPVLTHVAPITRTFLIGPLDSFQVGLSLFIKD